MSFRSDGTEGLKSVEKEDLQVPVDDIKAEWRMIWCNRIDDKIRAEGIANRDYKLLFVEQGTVIIATRDFKPLDLKKIIRSHNVQNIEQIDPPHPSVGGWQKFARTVLNKQKRARKWKMESRPSRKSNKKRQLKKGGRGWLHYRMHE